MGIVVTLDGVDGTGKSTIGRMLAQDGKYRYHKTPSGEFAQLRSEVDRHATALERYCFYQLSTQHDSIRLREMVRSTSVVCDRYVASTLAYHMTMDPRISTIHSNREMFVPDFAFLLTVESGERNRRLDIRAAMRSDIALEQNHELLDRVQATFLSLNKLGVLPFDLIQIDTTNKTSKEVVTAIEEVIHRRS